MNTRGLSDSCAEPIYFGYRIMWVFCCGFFGGVPLLLSYRETNREVPAELLGD